MGEGLRSASLGDITGFNESREGMRGLLQRSGDPRRENGLPNNVSSWELEQRLKDMDDLNKLQNPSISATAGGLVGAGIGLGTFRRPAGALMAVPTAIGTGVGSILGESIANRVGRPYLEKKIREKKGQEKKASLAEYSVLFDAIDSGKLGPHVKEALFGVCEGMSSSLQSHHAKVASESIEFSEADARQARLDQLLRRY